ncbi:NAD(P)-dependent dehydrogenase (short-subunit alcohol dehydrogenase family) [Branchiibius hedensis]|uniref:NAD(P)-dependent dehydrogenase, short-chain alcohol dehydrogenase family n=1 Tax=Branchiibius hedensis TaxID=672460 RepID=A0A2Y9BU95_9MICO|nr:SDR family NAD(P)-dependent oxidoreductase [Branchiibius hedensis]PWJ26540.1 NAD(P)-dependent dehydrogenase (short-subunit alcohol dehydrogenase family) [Branchiibius hedensis]SSA35352.1 NAD(P)-dependent dehydrogenase, short-chain alcohol dehydrogenase family [Branchiibius hedensis]
MELQGTSAIVSGGASGLGAATAAALAARGAAVFALDLAPSIEKASPASGVTLLEADVTNPEQVRQVIASAAEFAPLRTAVSCAGIGPPKRILNREGVADLDLFSRIVTINLVGTYTVLALAAEAISKTAELEHGQRGVIVNTASVAAFEGQIGQVAYSASKGGVVGLTLPAARDLAQYGIRVNTIAPGIIDTPLLASLGEEVRSSLAANVPFPHRLGQPEEYARLVTMIVEHDYLNGETIRMDGALRMAPR